MASKQKHKIRSHKTNARKEALRNEGFRVMQPKTGRK